MKRVFRTGTLSTLALLCIGAAQPVAAGVALQNASATYSAQNPCCVGLWHPRNTIDGRTSGSFTSWSIYQDPMQPATIVWETQADLTLTAQPLVFALHHQDFVPSPGHNLGRFRLSYTIDDRSTFADGLDIGGDVDANWAIIVPANAVSSGGETMTTLADSSILVSGGSNYYPTYTIRSAPLTVGGITGFRLEAIQDASLPFGGPGRQPANGNAHLSEFVVTTIPEPAAPLLAGFGLAALLLWRRLLGVNRIR